MKHWTEKGLLRKIKELLILCLKETCIVREMHIWPCWKEQSRRKPRIMRNPLLPESFSVIVSHREV